MFYGANDLGKARDAFSRRTWPACYVLTMRFLDLIEEKYKVTIPDINR